MEAREEWGRIAEASPSWPRARLYRGLEAFFRQLEARASGAEAVPDLESARRDGGSVARLAAGALALVRERWQETRTSLSGEAGWEAALLRACLEGHDPGGDRAAAVREYDQAIEEGNAFAWAHNQRGLARQAQGDLGGAIGDFSRALEINPHLAGPYNNRGIARHAEGNIAGAIEDWGHAIEIDPSLAEAHFNRGLARQTQGDMPGAIEDYGCALEINPRIAKAYANRGVARGAQGDLAGAIEDYRKALEVSPPDGPHRRVVEENLALAREALAGREGGR